MPESCAIRRSLSTAQGNTFPIQPSSLQGFSRDCFWGRQLSWPAACDNIAEICHKGAQLMTNTKLFSVTGYHLH